MTANLFSVLGALPIRGRLFTPQEDVPNGRSVSAVAGLFLAAVGVRALAPASAAWRASRVDPVIALRSE